MIEELKLEENPFPKRYEPKLSGVVGDKEEKKKEKTSFWDRVFNKKRLKRPDTVAVLFLRKNGVAEPMEVPIKHGFFSIYGKTYHEERDCIYRLGRDKYPLAMIPEWNVVPIGKKEWEDKPMQEKFHTLEDHVMKGIRHAEKARTGEVSDRKLDAKSIIVIGIVVIVALAFIMGYQ